MKFLFQCKNKIETRSQYNRNNRCLSPHTWEQQQSEKTEEISKKVFTYCPVAQSIYYQLVYKYWFSYLFALSALQSVASVPGL